MPIAEAPPRASGGLRALRTIAFQKGTDEMIKDLKLKVFPDRELRVLTVEAGKLGVRVV